ncbi:F-box domain, FBD domain, Leucine-rich repeat domain, L domain-like protein [Artemisia annua]|uniref:F-box domain, FBD domain, Leucine-rich repeat domain, L domain-like protein n=1 Tax=Artemisia annua TaxID=35608 RepID=A0A2U1ML64_ARTAN|nr:F-box domain, FBD domain, Leucine-rich repeat domain, L domain-like protein [Artemisia annua]
MSSEIFSNHEVNDYLDESYGSQGSGPCNSVATPKIHRFLLEMTSLTGESCRKLTDIDDSGAPPDWLPNVCVSKECGRRKLCVQDLRHHVQYRSGSLETQIEKYVKFVATSSTDTNSLPRKAQRLMSFFPKLQELELYIVNCKLLSDTEKRAPATFPYLKALTLHDIDFSSKVMTSLAIEFICASPNLETLWISGTWKNDVPPPADSTTEVNCISFGQLRDVVLGSCRGLENEVSFIKSLLACSPVLEKMSVIFSSVYSDQVLGHERDREQLRFAKELLTFHRASPVAAIVLY